MSVTISQLKDQLSRYLREVRRGRSVIVCDRDRVIARIEPAGGPVSARGDTARWLEELERRGTLRRGRGRLGAAWLKQRPRLKADLVAAVLRERDEGR